MDLGIVLTAIAPTAGVILVAIIGGWFALRQARPKSQSDHTESVLKGFGLLLNRVQSELERVRQDSQVNESKMRTEIRGLRVAVVELRDHIITLEGLMTERGVPFVPFRPTNPEYYD